jgi:hypothetical protein
MLESHYFDNFSTLMISVYTIYILFVLTTASVVDVDAVVLENIDSAFLTFFFVEICLKTFAS